MAMNYVGRIDCACETKSAIAPGLDSCMASMQSSDTKPIVVEHDVSSEEQVSQMSDEVVGLDAKDRPVRCGTNATPSVTSSSGRGRSAMAMLISPATTRSATQQHGEPISSF